LSTPGRTAGAVYKNLQGAQNLAWHPKAEREMTTSQPAAPTVERLREDQITVAAGVLARAFQNDPPLAYGIPNPAERARMLPMFMKPFVTFASLFGEAYVTAGKLESVAIWLPLDNLDETPEHDHQAGINTIPSIVGTEASARFMNIIRFVEAFHQRFAADRHLYLQWLGVEPSRQGQGLGSATITPELRRADSEALPCYLETFQPRNVPLYLKHGFQIMAEEVEPASGLRAWFFLRRPR
jgi:GNAT superfamily N-acetyltransferase